MIERVIKEFDKGKLRVELTISNSSTGMVYITQLGSNKRVYAYGINERGLVPADISSRKKLKGRVSLEGINYIKLRGIRRVLMIDICNNKIIEKVSKEARRAMRRLYDIEIDETTDVISCFDIIEEIQTS